MKKQTKSQKRKPNRVSITELMEVKIMNAINNPIMDLRLNIQRLNYTKNDLDTKLYNLSNEIFADVAKVLKIENP